MSKETDDSAQSEERIGQSQEAKPVGTLDSVGPYAVWVVLGVVLVITLAIMYNANNDAFDDLPDVAAPPTSSLRPRGRRRESPGPPALDRIRSGCGRVRAVSSE